MLITHEAQTYNDRQNLLSLVESHDSYELGYHPTMVPIIESANHEICIKIEDILSFAESNEYNDYGQALSDICESSGVSPNSITFVLQEDHAIANPSLTRIATNLLRGNANVKLLPLPENSIISRYGNYCLEQVEKDGDYEYWLGHKFCSYLSEEGLKLNSFEDLFTGAEEGDDDETRSDRRHLHYDEDNIRKRLYNAKSINDIDPKDLRAIKIRAYDTEKHLYGTDYMKNNDIDNAKKYKLMLPYLQQFIPDPKVRLELYKNPQKLVQSGLIPNNPELAEHLKKTIQDIEAKGTKDPEEVENQLTATQSEISMFQKGRFNRGEMSDPKVQANIKRENRMYNMMRVGRENLGNSLGKKEARENEEQFNRAKKSTQNYLNFVKNKHQGLEVEGLRDDKVAERVEQLSKMVDAEKFPKSWLAKKIAWLRSLYRNLMYKLTISKHETSGPISFVTSNLKKFAGFVLRLIDKLAIKLQNAVN